MRARQYREAGVDIDAGQALIDRIKPHAKSTYRPEVASALGGFAGLSAIPAGYREPMLVSCTDGVGTKLKLAIMLNRHDTVGQDLVAMCVNDLVVCGAEPLFFLDYFATGKLDVEVAEAVVRGIADACRVCNMSLLGGETAEMPGIYGGEDYDLAGFSVGVVEKANIINGQSIKEGDVLIGLSSSGIHSNGFSLVRKIINERNCDLDSDFAGETLGEALLKPTKLYAPIVRKLLEETTINGMAHITGGGLIENIPRMIPEGMCAVIHRDAWPRPALMTWLQQMGDLSDDDMWTTFNCGLGMVLCVPADEVDACLTRCEALGETATIVGEIKPGVNDETRIVIE